MLEKCSRSYILDLYKTTLCSVIKLMTKCNVTVTESKWKNHAGLWYYC